MGGPLAGVRVVELAGIGPAPFAGMLLADLGADVLRLQRPDPGALAAAQAGGDPRYDVLGRGRHTVTVDLKAPGAADLVLRLAARAEILIEGFRPGVAERLGIGPAEVHAANPALVYGRMTGWGQDGPLARTAGHDLTYLAVTGVLHAIGPADGPPVVPLNLVGDFGGGGTYLVMGVLAGLLEARTTGRGRVVDAAIVDGASSLAALMHGQRAAGTWHDARGTNLLDGSAPFYTVYECAGGGHIAVGALEPQFFAALVRGLDLADVPDLPDQYDRAGWPRLRALLAETFRRRTRDEWAARFEGTDACVAPVLSFAEAPAHPHLAARGTFTDVDGVVQPAPAPRFDGEPTKPTPRPGKPSAEILRDWDIEDIDPLLAAGVLISP